MGYRDNQVPFSDLAGKTHTKIVNSDSEIVFYADNGQTFYMNHEQDCCESVSVESIVGDLADIIGTPILRAEMATSSETPAGAKLPEYADDSQTWTFYKLASRFGYVDIRWFGSSNGYYSESVDFYVKEAKEPA